MSDFAIAKKKTYAVFLKSRRDGQDVYLREQYNVVEFDMTDPNRLTFVEGLRNDAVVSSTGAYANDFSAPERYDDIRVYDVPPFLTRLGSAQ